LGLPGASSVDSAATNASWGTSTRSTIFIRFWPSLSRTNHVGSPWLTRSVLFGIARHSFSRD
jgi:hypothetical protein